MRINGFNKTTLLDYPKHLAATLFLGGCNYRCPFCHNASLVLDPSSQPSISENEVLATLRKRRNILEGVCITGGEPTLQPDLPIFIEQIKMIGLKVKLDTNGNNPDMIQYLINNNLLDYVAMDIKNSKEHYSLSVGIKDFDTSNVCDSIELIMNSNIDYEFRTTLVKEHHTIQDIQSIGEWIKGANVYYLQSFKDSGDIITPGLSSHSKQTLLEYKDILLNYIPVVEIRGID